MIPTPFVLSSHKFLLLLVTHQTAFAKKYANIVLILFNKIFALLCSLHFKPGLLKYVLCSPCLALFPSWPFAILVLHSVLLKLSIFNLSLPKFLSFFPPSSAFLAWFFCHSQFCRANQVFSLFFSISLCLHGYSYLKTTS